MKQLFLILILQQYWLSVESNSKVKLRMDIVVAATFSIRAHEKELKDALLQITDTFNFDQQYTRMTLLDYNYAITYRTSFKDDYDKVVQTINDITRTEEEHRSYLYLALQEMLKIAQQEGRTNSLKVFVIMTHHWPTIGEGANYEYEEALPTAKKINETGLFFIVHEFGSYAKPKVMKYFEALCGEKNLIALEAMRNLNVAMEDKIFAKIIDRACERRERFCQFADSSQAFCVNVWHYTDEYMDAENCLLLRPVGRPDDCDVIECYHHCDRYWPWQNETENCQCSTGLRRRGQNPAPKLLAHCPISQPCPKCFTGFPQNPFFPGQEFGSRNGNRNVIGGLSMGAIVGICIVAVVGLSIIILAAMVLLKRSGLTAPRSKRQKIGDRGESFKRRKTRSPRSSQSLRRSSQRRTSSETSINDTRPNKR